MEKSAYRIIDANFNRAREAARVIEEFCRFHLNSNPLSAQAKKLRHELSGYIAQLDQAKLLTSRDVPADVGIGTEVKNQLKRADLNDCLTAGCKRLTEALRVLAEVIQGINPALAAKIEDLRYVGYTLEKDIAVFASAGARFESVRLYVILTGNDPAEIIPLAKKCVQGGADCIQLRAKSLPGDQLCELAGEFVNICRAGSVLSIINDRIDIAVATDADGVHLGQHDLKIAHARKLQNRPLIIGQTTHTPEQLKKAVKDGADYVSLGPVFKTGTKPEAKPVGMDYVREGLALLKETGVGHVAIGGITADNIAEILSAGITKVAICGEIMNSKNPAEVCRKLVKTMAHPGV